MIWCFSLSLYDSKLNVLFMLQYYWFEYIKDIVIYHFSVLFDEHKWHSCWFTAVLCPISISFFLFLLICLLSASTLWPSQLCLVGLSPPSLPVPMLLVLCLPRLSLSPSQLLTNLFSWAWLDKLAFAPASVFFSSLHCKRSSRLWLYNVYCELI